MFPSGPLFWNKWHHVSQCRCFGTSGTMFPSAVVLGQVAPCFPVPLFGTSGTMFPSAIVLEQVEPCFPVPLFWNKWHHVSQCHCFGTMFPSAIVLEPCVPVPLFWNK